MNHGAINSSPINGASNSSSLSTFSDQLSFSEDLLGIKIVSLDSEESFQFTSEETPLDIGSSVDNFTLLSAALAEGSYFSLSDSLHLVPTENGYRDLLISINDPLVFSSEESSVNVLSVLEAFSLASTEIGTKFLLGVVESLLKLEGTPQGSYATVISDILNLTSEEDIGNLVQLADSLSLLDAFELSKVVLGIVDTLLTLSSNEDPASVSPAELKELLKIVASNEGLAKLLGEVSCKILLSESSKKPEPLPEYQLSMNTRLTAISEYKGFQFSSLVKKDGTYYLFGEDGFFKVDDSPVDIKLKTPLLNFNDSNLKTITTLYVNGEVDKDLTVSLGVDKKYNFKYRKSKLSHKIDLGKGPRGKHFSIALEGTEVKDFTFHLLEVLLHRYGRKL